VFLIYYGPSSQRRIIWPRCNKKIKPPWHEKVEPERLKPYRNSIPESQGKKKQDKKLKTPSSRKKPCPSASAENNIFVLAGFFEKCFVMSFDPKTREKKKNGDAESTYPEASYLAETLGCRKESGVQQESTRSLVVYACGCVTPAKNTILFHSGGGKERGQEGRSRNVPSSQWVKEIKWPVPYPQVLVA
jgi:hypothetical protein